MLTDDQRRKLEELFARHGEGIGGFVLARVGSEELAEEITSRVFVTAVRAFWQCRRSPAAWLWSIVRTELALHFRRRRADEPAGADIADPADPPDEQVRRREERGRLRDALAELPEQLQTVLYMKFFQDMRNVDIAEATGLTASHVGVLVHRSLKRLRSLMEGRGLGGA